MNPGLLHAGIKKSGAVFATVPLRQINSFSPILVAQYYSEVSARG